VELLAVGSLALLAAYLTLPRLRSVALGALAVATIAAISVVLWHGTWTERKSPTTSFERMHADKRARPESFPFFLPEYGHSSADVRSHSLRTFLDPDLAKVYTKWSTVRSRTDAYQLMDQGRRPDVAVVEDATTSEGADSPQTVPRSAARCAQMLYGSNNLVAFDVTAPSRALFVLAYPFSHHWRARVNGVHATIVRANGVSQGVRIPPGRSVIEFRYWSTASVVGMAVSCLVLVFVGLWVLLAVARRNRRLRPLCVALAILTVAVGAVAYGSWRYGLYTGGDFGSRRVWCAGETWRQDNLAYGHRTAATGTLPSEYPELIGSARAVDGSREQWSLCESEPQWRPHWTLDLGANTPIGAIITSRPAVSQGTCVCSTLAVLGSTDARVWWTLGQANARTGRQAVDTIACPEPCLARYLMLATPDSCALTLNEVEVYAPADHLHNRKQADER
jgi:hypothetical protein